MFTQFRFGGKDNKSKLWSERKTGWRSNLQTQTNSNKQIVSKFPIKKTQKRRRKPVGAPTEALLFVQTLDCSMSCCCASSPPHLSNIILSALQLDVPQTQLPSFHFRNQMPKTIPGSILKPWVSTLKVGRKNSTHRLAHQSEGFLPRAAISKLFSLSLDWGGGGLHTVLIDDERGRQVR